MSYVVPTDQLPGHTWCYEHKHWVKVGEWHRDDKK